jgi:hypothetical protein
VKEVELELVPFDLGPGVCEGVRAKKPDCLPPAPAREGSGNSSKSIKLVSTDFMLSPFRPGVLDAPLPCPPFALVGVAGPKSPKSTSSKASLCSVEKSPKSSSCARARAVGFDTDGRCLSEVESRGVWRGAGDLGISGSRHCQQQGQGRRTVHIPFGRSPSSLHRVSQPRSSLTILARALHPRATVSKSGIGRNETIDTTTTSGNRPMNGPCVVRAAGLVGFITLNLEDEEGWPGLLGARGTHLFMFMVTRV